MGSGYSCGAGAGDGAHRSGVLLVHEPGFGVCGAGAGDGAIVLGLGGPARARRRKRVLQGWRALPPFAVRSVVVTTFHRIDWR